VAAVASWFAGGSAADAQSLPDSGERTGEEPFDYELIEEAPDDDLDGGTGSLSPAHGGGRR
jgi:hypothetical protein